MIARVRPTRALTLLLATLSVGAASLGCGPASGSIPDSPSQVRPRARIVAAYQFADARPDLLDHIPCFCGCGQAGHKSASECFVKRRGRHGRAVEWQPHGAECGVCIDIVTQTADMHAHGTTLRAIYDSIVSKYRSLGFTRMTETAAP